MNKWLTCILLSLAMVAAAAPEARAQRQRNYIYLFDCTQSMQDLGIWQPAKDALQSTIEKQSEHPEAQFTVIPFQAANHRSYDFEAGQFGRYRDDILADCDKYIAARTNTNLVAALEGAFAKCRPEMENNIYLLTDGTDNVQGTRAVVDLINRWCSNHNNTRLFYVTLDPRAVDPAIKAACDGCPDAYLVNCHNGVIPPIAYVSPAVLYGSVTELDAVHTVMASESVPGGLAVECDDPFFKAVPAGGGARSLSLRFEPRRPVASVDSLNALLAPHTDAEGNYIFTIRAAAADPRSLIVANPEVTVVMSNRRQRRMSLLTAGFDEVILKPGADSYGAFLWSPARDPQPVELDLAPEFNEAARAAGSSVDMRLLPAHGQEPDFAVLFNGSEPAGPGGTFTVRAGQPARVQIIFTPGAATGKRYFRLQCTGARDIDVLNGVAVGPAGDAEALDEASIDVRTTNTRRWNPLAVLLFWLAVGLTAALVLWFAVLRRIFFPRFAVAAIEITGPGSYYLRKKLKKYREVRLTARPARQGALSRIFTGPVLIVRDAAWSPAITLRPGARRSVRASGAGHEFVPSAVMRRGESYEVINSATGEKSRFTIE